MKKRNLILCSVTYALVGLAAISLNSVDARADNHDEVLESLINADKAWSASAQKEDKSGFFGTVLENVVLLAPHQPAAKGRDAFGGLLALPNVELSWSPSTGEVSKSGDLGYTYGTYNLKFDGPDGAPVVDEGKYMTVWKKQEDGSWKVAADMFNTSLPMASKKKDSGGDK